MGVMLLMSNSKTKASRDLRGENNPFYGHRHNSVSRSKIAESQRARYQKAMELLHLKSLSIRSLDKIGDTPG